MSSGKPNVRVLSLFSGGGGLDLGFEKAGFEIVACVEIDKFACETLRLNQGTFFSKNLQVLEEDITQLDPSSLGLEKVDFMIGGPPCQSFSAGGRRAGGVTGINDTRGSLFWHYCRFLKHFKPAGFLFENVRGILQANKARDWEIIRKSFADVGYKLSFRILDAAAYGVPQHRERVILVGSRLDTDVDFLFPRPSHGPDSKARSPYVTVGEAFSDIDDPSEEVEPYSGKYGHLIPDIPPGLNYSFYTEKLGHPEPRFAWRSKFSGFLYKLDPNGLSKTVVAHQGKYDGPFHWKNRKLNQEELMRVQGFPDSYQFVKSRVEVVRQIGNSVCPPLANSLAKAVMQQFFGSRKKLVELLPKDAQLSFDSRKASKAARTRRKLQKKNMPGQPELFNPNIVWPSTSYSEEQSLKAPINGKFDSLMKLKDGTCKLVATKRTSETCLVIKLALEFSSAVGASFQHFDGELQTNDPLDLCVLWNFVHQAVDRVSSYDSLQPLYGHFTEPYPKFNTQVQFVGAKACDKGLCAFLTKMTRFEYIRDMKPLSQLSFLEKGNRAEFVRKLRERNFDIRITETNRTIPKGFMKICYPFSLALNEKTYVTWSEIGSHKTSDVQFNESKDEIQKVVAM